MSRQRNRAAAYWARRARQAEMSVVRVGANRWATGLSSVEGNALIASLDSAMAELKLSPPPSPEQQPWAYSKALRTLLEQVERVVEAAADDELNHVDVPGFGRVHHVMVGMPRSDWDHGLVAAASAARRVLETSR